MRKLSPNIFLILQSNRAFRLIQFKLILAIDEELIFILIPVVLLIHFKSLGIAFFILNECQRIGLAFRENSFHIKAFELEKMTIISSKKISENCLKSLNFSSFQASVVYELPDIKTFLFIHVLCKHNLTRFFTMIYHRE